MDTQKEYATLMEAYNAVYELDENRMASRMEKMPSAPAKVGKGTHSIKDIPVSREPSPEEKAKARKALKLKESDLYDIILSHLLDEGYADTNEAALAIMANMSEEWRQSIVEVLDTPERANEYAKKNVRSMLGAFAKGVVNKDMSQVKTIKKRGEGAKMAKRKAERKAAEEES
jgi:hypothetical protein